MRKNPPMNKTVGTTNIEVFKLSNGRTVIIYAAMAIKKKRK